MSPNSSPIPSLKGRRPRATRTRQLASLVLVLALVIASSISTGQACAQKSIADVASIDRALAGNAPAYHALQEGRVEDAATLLRATLAANPADAFAHQLFCRVFYAQNAADEAIHQCELAVSSHAANNEQASDAYLWLGRAYGMKARHAGPIAGFTLARKVKSSFARAVELNPSSVPALNDLGEYYVAAPFIVGGGADKAQALAARIMPRSPGAAHRMLARMADADNDLGSAESEFKQAIAAEKSPEAWIDLAQFYQAHARPDDALSAIRSGLAADRAHGPALVDAASILTAAQRDPGLAERCLRDYLASRAKSDVAPAFKVHLQLSRLLAARGDTREASREVEAAAALAPTFRRNTRQVQGL
jgi:tetratricopeptide (TPR) repeat protein